MSHFTTVLGVESNNVEDVTARHVSRTAGRT